jgi:hypothetical protein
MIYAGQADGPALVRYPIVQEQMATVHLDANAIAPDCQNALFADGRNWHKYMNIKLLMRPFT